ncbi:MAG: DUF2865 domain-containing protein [Chloroflexota bacterium]
MAHRWKDRAGMAGAVVMRFARWIGPLGMAFWLALTPSPGAAQGLLEFLFGAPAPPPAAPRPRESVPTRRDRVQGELRYARPRDGNSFSSDPSVGGFCVRSCDGYYFPLIKSTRATRQQSCEMACPSAQMEIFDGSTIETARNRKGQRYSALPGAFAFRDKANGACACNDPRTSQAYFEQNVRSDPTLQSGDVIVETEGAFVYRGSKLVPLSGASFMPPALRDRLRAMLRRAPATAAVMAPAEPAGPPFQILDDDRTGSTPPPAKP